MIRYLLVTSSRDEREARAYLPDNYRVLATVPSFKLDERTEPRDVIVVSGRDVAGWTLDGYVIPRLRSGMIVSYEIDLSHPVMKLVEST